MDHEPKVPAKSHVKNGTVITNRPLDDMAKETGAKEAEPERYGGRIQSIRAGPKLRTLMRSGSDLISGKDDSRLPRPSDDEADPLNWSRTRKELAFAAILVSVACFCALKTMLVSVTSVVATQLSVSYSATTALTGAPLVMGAFAGLGSQILSQTVGKRGILIGSAVLVLGGALWNMHVEGSYAQFMISRIFQGIGWGAFEGLVGGVVEDIFFVYERNARIIAYNIVSIVFTWGSPILGGFVSQSTEGYANQIMIINTIQAVGILLLIFGMPETTYHRSLSTASYSASVTGPTATGFRAYAKTLRLSNSHSSQAFSISAALRPVKALVAPSTLMVTLLTAPLYGTALGSAHSLSLLFSAMPTFLFPSRIGFLFILPAVFTLVLYTITASITHYRSRGHLGTAGIGMLTAVIGMLSWGMYVASELMPGEYESDSSVFSLSVTGLNLSLRAVSALFGLLAAGAATLSLLGNAHLLYSFPSSDRESGMGGLGGELAAAHHTLGEMLLGVWIAGLPMWIASDEAGMIAGLKTTIAALAVLGVVVGSSVGAVLWVKGGEIRRVDVRVMGKRIGDGEGGVGDDELKKWRMGGV